LLIVHKIMIIKKITEIEIKNAAKIAQNILGQSEDDAISYLSETIKMKNGAVFIAKNEYNILGFIRGTYTEWNMIGNIGLIATTEAARGKGIGKALISAFEKWAREKGVRKIFVDTCEENKNAMIFYIKCGYIPEMYMSDYYADGSAGINFGKQINPSK